MTPTTEQQSVVETSTRMQPGELCLVNAYAGSGKTTTLKLIANAIAPLGLTALYICYNADMARDAKGSLPHSVECRTSHSLAYGQMMRQFPRWRERLGNLRARDLQTALRLDTLTAQAAVDTFQHFLCLPLDREQTPDPKTAFNSSLVADAGWGFLEAYDVQSVIRGCVAVYESIFEGTGPASIKVPHDAYLWAFIFGNPVVQADVVLLDEGQDLNPLMLRFIQIQLAAGKRVVLVGDRHQSIYGFRRATNALESMAEQATYHLTLTECFRFPQGTANAASKLLAKYKGDSVRLVGRGQAKPGTRPSRCYIARTNAAIVQRASELVFGGHKMHFAATRPEANFSPRLPYKFDEIEDVYRIWANNPPSSIRTPWLRQFHNYAELLDYATPSADGAAETDTTDKGGDVELASMVKLVEKYQHSTFAVLKSIEALASDDSSASWCLSSAHRSKGKEWDNTFLADDFLPLDDPAKLEKFRAKLGRREFEESVNLLYVAITRGRVNTTYPGNCANFFTN